jgi:hypothetical protein
MVEDRLAVTSRDDESFGSRERSSIGRRTFHRKAPELSREVGKMKNSTSPRKSARAEVAWITLAVCLFAWVRISAETTGGQAQPGSASRTAADRIPFGTILPVVLDTSVSFEKCKTGQMLHGKIAQEVPLPNGSKIRKGSPVVGHIVSLTRNANGAGAQIAMQFDSVYMIGQWVPVVTDLRAIAGFMAIQEAQTPEEAPNEGSPYNWLPTTQLGGDSVYGVGGKVMSADDPAKVIGRSVGDGVLVPASAKEGSKCRGEVDGNDKPQAMWLFSSDACGVYGIEHLKIAHAGRTNPKGTIVLASDTEKLSLRNGDGLLLRVD